MDIDGPLKELGRVNSLDLASAIANLSETDWIENPSQSATGAVVLASSDTSNWPNIEVRQREGWDQLAKTAVPVMHNILAMHYGAGGTIVQALAARLPAGSHIQAPQPNSQSNYDCHRIHIPTTSHSNVTYSIDDQRVELKTGEAYEINSTKKYSISNEGDEDITALIFEYAPPGAVNRTIVPSLPDPE